MGRYSQRDEYSNGESRGAVRAKSVWVVKGCPEKVTTELFFEGCVRVSQMEVMDMARTFQTDEGYD